jgi:hypothetical protein
MSVRLNDAEWLRRQLGPDEYSSEDDERDAQKSADATTDADEKVIDGRGEPTGATADGAQSDQNAGGARTGKLDRKVVVRFGGLAAAGIVIMVLGAMLLSGGGESASRSKDDSSARPVAVVTTAAPTPVAAEATGVDRPLTFSASANCPAGSTSAQTLDGSDPTNAFMCVRNLVDGQVIRLVLPKTYVITAISVTPGWLGKDSSGRSQWAQHRVISRVQYVFDDTEHTIIMQDTGNVHGEAVQPVKHVLASKITMLILQTSRPPAETTTAPKLGQEAGPGPGVGPEGGLGGGFFGDPGTASSSLPSPAPLAPMAGLGGRTMTDPVDATFAISRLKIIGHEAV